ncbi:MAG: hypothetical protein NC820_06650 [Candidatus Omnitrophica bacterium]|nr:hypothetical protein [Candidatus Omnitrophota bacterium]
MRKIFILLIFSLFIFPYGFSAQLSLQPIEVNLDVVSGSSFNGAIKVRNGSSENITVIVYVEDFEYTPPFKGAKNPLPLGTVERSCGKWIKLNQQMLYIPAYGEREVSYTIDVPNNVKGSYWAVVFFEEKSQPIKSSIGVGLSLRVGCSFFLNTKDSTKKLDLRETVGEVNAIKGRLCNDGDTLIIFSGSFYIVNEEGIGVQRGVLPMFFLPPLKETSFDIAGLQDLLPENYTLYLTFDLGEGDSLFREIDFVKEEDGKVNIKEIRD